MFGHGLNERRRHVHLADGGHFDNLGLYELLRRRCRRILVCDAGADPTVTLAALGQVVQRARADFGVTFRTDAEGGIESLDFFRPDRDPKTFVRELTGSDAA